MACGEFQRRFPEVEVSVDMGLDPFGKLEQDKLEMIFSHRCDKTRFASEILYEDRFIIAVRKDTVGAEKLLQYALTREEILSGKVDEGKEITDYSLFENINFLRYGKNGSTWANMYELLEHCTFLVRFLTATDSICIMI